MDYFDILLAKKLEDDRDPKVEGLSVSANGRYHENGVVYDPVIVNVPQTPLSKLTVTENGTYTAPTGTAYNEVEVDVPLPENAYLLKDIPNTPTAIATFSDGSDLPMPKLEVGIEPVQDLHGYDAPWVGGAGKNKLQVTAETQTVNGITYTVNDDGTITANGTANDDSRFDFGIYIAKAQSQQIMNGLPNSVTDDSINMGYQGYGVINKTTRELVINRDTDRDWNNYTYILIKNGTTVNNLVFYPMIRLATETDASFTPYSNICPISGWDEVNVWVCGVNVWDEEWFLDSNYRLSSKNYIPVKANTEYLFGNTLLYSITCYDINKNSLGGASLTQVPNIGYKFTTKPNTYYIKFNVGNSYGTTYNNDISINYPSTDTSYHAYNGHIYTIDLNGTRYGGKVDLVSGVMTVDRVMFALNGSENWTTDIVGDNKRRFTCTSLIDLGVTTTTTFDAISNIYVNTKSASYIDLSEVFILRYLSQYNQNRIDIMTEAYQDVASFKAFLNSTNMQIVYELATPLTIQLPTTVVKSLRGVNNVFADCGNILDLSYFGTEE